MISKKEEVKICFSMLCHDMYSKTLLDFMGILMVYGEKGLFRWHRYLFSGHDDTETIFPMPVGLKRADHWDMKAGELASGLMSRFVTRSSVRELMMAREDPYMFLLNKLAYYDLFVESSSRHVVDSIKEGKTYFVDIHKFYDILREIANSEFTNPYEAEIFKDLLENRRPHERKSIVETFFTSICNGTENGIDIFIEGV